MIRPSLQAALSAAILSISPPIGATGTADDCRGVDELSGIFIKHRQHDISSLQTMMEKFGHVPALREMILEAYSIPRMPTPETRQLVVEEFQNRWMIRCYQDGPLDLSEERG